MNILNVINGLYLIGLLWERMWNIQKEIIFYDEIKNFNEEKVISLFSIFVKVHVFIITMRQGAESEKIFVN